MATFVIETFVSAARPGELKHAAARLREAVHLREAAGRSETTHVSQAAHLREATPTPTRLVRSFYLPEDETCLYIVEAPSMEAAVELSRLAGLQPDRIIEAQAADA